MGTPKQAAVDIVENVPAGQPARSPQVLMAEEENKQITTVEQATGEDGTPVRTTHTRPGTLVMYKPTGTHGYMPKTVSGSSLGLLLRQG